MTWSLCGSPFRSMSGKMSITAGDKVFYYMTRDSLCFLAMAEARYPKRLAFLYLDEIGDLVLGEMVREFGNEVGFGNRSKAFSARVSVVEDPRLMDYVFVYLLV